MANTIKIKRSTSTATPTSLAEGELAFSESSNNLFIGTSGSNVANIGGKIGVTVQAYDTNIVSDATYQSTENDFTNTLKTKLDTVAQSANNYSLPSSVVHDTESGALHATDALRISGHTVSLYKGNGTSESVTIPDNNTTYSVGNGGLTQNNLTNALKSNYDAAHNWYTTMTTSDGDSVINTVTEIVAAFQNHAEGLNLITELDAKLTAASTIDGGTF